MNCNFRSGQEKVKGENERRDDDESEVGQQLKRILVGLG
jgi:hypothetical protein